MKEYQNFSTYNARTIFQKITHKHTLLLCIDALDFVSLSSGEPSPRLKIRFTNFDNSLHSGEKTTDCIDIFIPIGKFLVFSNDILNGVFLRKKRSQSDIPTKLRKPYFEFFGGTYGPPPISRKFSLVDGLGENATFAFLATAGDATVSDSGVILPKGNKVNASIFINMSDSELKEFCLIGKAYVEQYISLDLQNRLSLVRKMRNSYTSKKDNSP